MLLQFLITQAGVKNYPVPSLNKRVRAKVTQIHLADSLGANQHRVYRISSPSIQNLVASHNNAILFPRYQDHTVIDFANGPEIIIDCKGLIQFEVDTVVGGAAGTVSACLLTVDVLEEIMD